jgi:ERF superfamily
MSNIGKSESITALAKALAKFHATAPAIVKNAQNPHFKNRFADLSGILEVIRIPLANVGLSVLQLLGDNTLTTILLHESGEFIETTAPLIVAKHDMQGLGSACSYQRRYSLQSLLSLSASDDDGNDACRHDSSPNEKFAPAKKSAPAKDWNKELADLMTKNKVTAEDVIEFSRKKGADLESLKDLPPAFAKRLCEVFEDVVAHSMSLAA